MSLLGRAARRGTLRLAPARERVRDERAVALTVDDGPDPVFTPRVLDVLAEHGARATFFLVGRRAAREPELVRRIVSEGHAVGSHSWSHREPGTLSRRELWSDYRAGRQAVEAAAGGPVRLFRPPRGLWDARTALHVRASRLEPWLWTLDSEDWRPGVTPEAIAGQVARARGGDVVLLHDGLELPTAPSAEDRSATVAALPLLLAGLRARGLECVVLDA